MTFRDLKTGLLALALLMSAVVVVSAAGTITVTDAAGREITVSQPLERVVVLASQPAEVIAALGAQDAVVGVTANHVLRDPLTKEIYQGRPSVGEILNPSVESILELDPQLVISLSAWGGARQAALALADQLAPYGIPVALIDCFPDVGSIFRDVTTLGKLFGREAKAQEYIAFFQRYLDLIATRTQGIAPSDRRRAYLEVVDYTVTSWGHRMIAAAGGKDVAAEAVAKAPSVRVSPEWVLAQNPQVIIARAMPPRLMGYGTKENAQIRAKWDDIVSRPGWEGMDAVREGRVYLLAFEICSAPRAPIGILYLAKWFYPDLFPDLDPGAIQREFLTRFFGIADYPGLFVYPEGK